MSELIDDKTKQEVQKILKSMINPVEVIFFTRSGPCPFCEQQRKILDIISTLSDKIRIKTLDFDEDKKLVIKYKIDKAPATLIIGEKDYGIRFYGITGGHEFTSLIQSLIMASTRKSGLHPELEKHVKNIKKPVHIEVMITLTCPYCPAAVHAAHQLAMINDNITADMVDSSVFQELAEKYQVVGVPKTIINEVHRFEGAQPPQSLYLEILKTIDPDEYQRIEAMIREQNGHRHVRKPDPGNVYDTIIVGGGPAAMSAAVYTARKDLDVLLITNKIGGQITYTASIDNYLGLPSISGEEMKTQFTFHMEQYPIAESIGSNVSRVEKKENTFLVITENKKQYTGFTVIFCTGKEYNRLGVPGEERFLGHGIAFCATCDAPLYRGKKVAVIGGANSAFTAARDLIAFASDIYLIHRSSEFRADSTLVNEVKKAPNVKFYPDMEVKEFIGENKLIAVNLISTDQKNQLKLDIDGAFLEIGLSPNTDPVRDLTRLNDRGEIVITQDNSTEIPGFFAAGDATNISQKQIIVAAAEGAKAALSAYNHLVEKKLASPKTGETWQ